MIFLFVCLFPVPIATCPPVGIQHGFYDDNIILSSKSRDVGTVVRISCRDGSRLKGPGVLLCENRGHWNGSRPHCEVQGLSNYTFVFREREREKCFI